MEHGLIYLILFVSVFLILTGLVQNYTQKVSFLPYTVALLVAGALGQLIVHVLHLPIHIELSSEIIYYLLLPLLLFESTLHINFHQFRLQFKTITFFATFGLLVSVFVVAAVLSILLGYSWNMSLLFGAIISATDPIAVIALFKSLGAPKRLGLVADGESMLNDATGVIAFKIVSGFVLTETAFGRNQLYSGISDFLYIFIISILFGALVGYVMAKLIEKINNDKVVETTLTVALALGSFTAAEHFFHLSGVISTVIAGIVMGNLGKTKFSSPVVREFVEEFWSYFAYLALSLVFFFATFNLQFGMFLSKPWEIFAAIIAVLVGRAVSVYMSAFISNRWSFFDDEPNIPMSWQHILNWGGLRGVIPLVLVYSLPEEFAYRDDMLRFTLGAFLFTLLVNGLTIRSLLLALGLHLKRVEDEVIEEERQLLQLDEAKAAISGTRVRFVSDVLLSQIEAHFSEQIDDHCEKLRQLALKADFKQSIQLQALQLERGVLGRLFHEGLVTESAFYSFESELDIQEDSIEFPELKKGRAMVRGMVDTSTRFLRNMSMLRSLIDAMPFIARRLKNYRAGLIHDRLGLLTARIVTSEAVVSFLERLQSLLSDRKDIVKELQKAIDDHRSLISDNQNEFTQLGSKYPIAKQSYENRVSAAFLEVEVTGNH